jgi:hypothetical protein
MIATEVLRSRDLSRCGARTCQLSAPGPRLVGIGGQASTAITVAVLCPYPRLLHSLTAIPGHAQLQLADISRNDPLTCASPGRQHRFLPLLGIGRRSHRYPFVLSMHSSGFRHVMPPRDL